MTMRQDKIWPLIREVLSSSCNQMSAITALQAKED